jgi:hypothetical protein
MMAPAAVGTDGGRTAQGRDRHEPAREGRPRASETSRSTLSRTGEAVLSPAAERREESHQTLDPGKASIVKEHDVDLSQLHRVRWAVRVVLALGVAASVAANVLHAEPTAVGRAIAAWPPLALLLTIELISRVPMHRPALTWVRRAATATIAGIAAWVSYWHMVGVCVRYGESPTSAHLIPLSVDGLVVVASVCLVELAGRIRETETTPVPVRPVAEAPTQPGIAAYGGTASRTVRSREPRTGESAPSRAGTQRARRSGTRTDDELTAVLANVPREKDGTVPVRRAAAALACGPDRARRLLAAQGLLRNGSTNRRRSPTLAA